MGKNFWKIILAFAIGLKIGYFFLTPPGQLPDEKFNLKRIRTNINYPQSIFFPDNEIFYYQNNEYFYPPLYFLASSFVVKTIGYGLSNGILISILRFLSLVISTLSLFLIWKIFEKISSSNLVKLTSFIFIAFLPTMSSFSVSANPNNLAFFLITLFIYLTVKNYDQKISIKAILLMGIVFGLAILTKSDSFVVLPFIFYPLSTLRKQKKPLFKYIIVFLVASFIFGGWWYLANYLRIGYFYNQKLFEASISQTIIPFSYKYYIYVVVFFTLLSFFATFGSINNIYLNYILYTPVVILLLISFFGLIKKISLPSGVSKNKQFFYIPFFLSLIANLYLFFTMNFNYSFQSQGRYLFNSIIFLSLIWAYGLFYFLPKKIHKIIPVSIFVVFLLLNILCFDCNLRYFHGKNIFPKSLRCVGNHLPIGNIGFDIY